MTPEELLKPRYKVVAIYPFCPYNIGDMVLFLDSETSFHLTTTWYWEEGEKVESDNYAPVSALETYAHLFKKLEWWEDRKPEDMPGYIKEANSLYKIGEVVKVAEWEMESEDRDLPCFRDEKDEHFTWVRGFAPATEAEYNQYIKQKEG